MYLTTHAAAGLLVGVLVQQPAVAFTGSVVTHFLLDMVPHEPPEDLILTYPRDNTHDKHTVRKRTIVSFFDLIGLAIVVYFAMKLALSGEDFHSTITGVAAGITGSIFPDAVIVLTFFFDNAFLRRYFDFHNKIHCVVSGMRVSNIVSAVYQVILSGVLIYAAFRIMNALT
jgi:hypothetical protein